MGQALSSNNLRHRHFILFIPHLLLSSVVGFSLINRLIGSPLLRTNRLTSNTCDYRSIGMGLENAAGHNISAFEDSYSLYLKLTKDNEMKSSNNTAIKSALTSLSDALRIFGPECVIASYNGGKDAVVIMHLLRAALADYSVKHGKLWRPKLIYFVHDKEFPEIKELVYSTASRYDLELVTYDTGFVDGLTRSVSNSNGKPLAFVLGTRKGDPNCGDQEVFAPSSDWMPPFMRVNPILAWDYSQVWRFLIDNELPYCSLYDEGYTSLGRIDNTLRNPALRCPSGSYLPASALEDSNLERAGREKVEATDVSSLAVSAMQHTSRSLQHAKSAFVIFVEEPIKAVDNLNLPVSSVVSIPLSELQDEVKRQSDRFDFVVVVRRREESSPHVELAVDTISFGVSAKPKFYSNVLRVETMNQISDLRQKLSDNLFPEMVFVVSAHVLKICQQIIPKLQSAHKTVLFSLFAGFDFLAGDSTVVLLHSTDPAALKGLQRECNANGWKVELMKVSDK